MTLKTTLLELCRYSFEHMRMYDSGSTTTMALRSIAIDMLAYQIACFLANNTNDGKGEINTKGLASELERAYNKKSMNFGDLEGFVDFLMKEYGG